MAEHSSSTPRYCKTISLKPTFAFLDSSFPKYFYFPLSSSGSRQEWPGLFPLFLLFLFYTIWQNQQKRGEHQSMFFPFLCWLAYWAALFQIEHLRNEWKYFRNASHTHTESPRLAGGCLWLSMGKLHSDVQARTKQTSNKGALVTLSKCIKMHWHAQANFCLGIPGKQRQLSDSGNIWLWVLHYLRFAFSSDPSTPVLSKPAGCLSGKDLSHAGAELLARHGSTTRINNNCLRCSVHRSCTAVVKNS